MEELLKKFIDIIKKVNSQTKEEIVIFRKETFKLKHKLKKIKNRKERNKIIWCLHYDNKRIKEFLKELKDNESEIKKLEISLKNVVLRKLMNVLIKEVTKYGNIKI